jgi:peptidoglycan hydrolase-like protein with peptidoglycan-binding domain
VACSDQGDIVSPIGDADVPWQIVQQGDTGPGVEAVQRFLSRLGYLPNPELAQLFVDWHPAVEHSPVAPDVYDESMTEAVRAYQRFHAITVDGKVNAETLALMQQPRCGFPDIVPSVRRGTLVLPDSGLPSGSVGYALSPYRWTYSNLTWGFANYTRDLRVERQREAAEHGVAQWGSVTPLSFSESPNPDILIGFYVGAHGDGYPFRGVDRPAGAHTGYPPPYFLTGDIHFNDYDHWTFELPPEDLVYVMLHELGHSLGLDHSSVPGTVMYGVFRTYAHELRPDDIAGIQRLYGAR